MRPGRQKDVTDRQIKDRDRLLSDARLLMSDEDTDLVLDDVMGEVQVVISESTFPAAPLVRPPAITPAMLPPVLAAWALAHTTIEQTAEAMITAASPSDIVRVSPTVATTC